MTGRFAGLAVVTTLVAGCSAILGLGDGSIAGDGGPGGDAGSLPASSDHADADSAMGADSTVGPQPDGGGADSTAKSQPDGGGPPAIPCDGGPGICVSFTPSGGVPVADLNGEGLAAITLSVSDAQTDAAPGDTILNVDNGEMTSVGAVIRPASTGDPTVRDVQKGIAYRQNNGLAIVTFGSLTIPAGTTLKLVGIHPVVLLSSTTIRVDGMVDVRAMSADGTAVCFPTGAGSSGPTIPQAPGGYVGGAGYVDGHEGFSSPAMAGMGPGAGSPSVAGGGGGGGHASAGASGCLFNDAGTCGPGGGTYDDPVLDATGFHGGSGGGGAGISHNALYSIGGSGGNGGGALRLVAASAIEITGQIDASGCGGNPGGGNPQVWLTSGGGGGAGGAIVIEAPSVTLSAASTIFALGGAGGSIAGAGGTSSSNRGCYETFLTSSHAGAGAGSTPSPTVDASAQAGAAPDCAGGGGFGWIRINAGGGNAVIAGGATLNPNPASGYLTLGTLAP